jgi:hypothetical protein
VTTKQEEEEEEDEDGQASQIENFLLSVSVADSIRSTRSLSIVCINQSLVQLANGCSSLGKHSPHSVDGRGSFASLA